MTAGDDHGLFPERIETERLRLEPLTVETVDVLQFYRICSGTEAEDIEEVTRYLTWDPHETPKETLDFLEHVTEKRREGDGAEYLIYPKEGEDGAGQIAGATGLTVDWDRRTGTLGAWLRKPYWGRGYSGERAAALIDVAFERLDLELVSVTTIAGNEKSRRAIEKYVEAHGGRHEGLLRNWDARGGEPYDVHRFSITRSEYESASG